MDLHITIIIALGLFLPTFSSDSKLSSYDKNAAWEEILKREETRLAKEIQAPLTKAQAILATSELVITETLNGAFHVTDTATSQLNDGRVSTSPYQEKKPLVIVTAQSVSPTSEINVTVALSPSQIDRDDVSNELRSSSWPIDETKTVGTEPSIHGEPTNDHNGGDIFSTTITERPFTAINGSSENTENNENTENIVQDSNADLELNISATAPSYSLESTWSGEQQPLDTESVSFESSTADISTLSSDDDDIATVPTSADTIDSTATDDGYNNTTSLNNADISWELEPIDKDETSDQDEVDEYKISNDLDFLLPKNPITTNMPADFSDQKHAKANPLPAMTALPEIQLNKNEAQGPSTFTIIAIIVPITLVMVVVLGCSIEYRRKHRHHTSQQNLLNHLDMVPKKSVTDFQNPHYSGDSQLTDEVISDLKKRLSSRKGPPAKPTYPEQNCEPFVEQDELQRVYQVI